MGKRQNRKYGIDKEMKLYLSSMANRAHFDERCAFLQQQASHGRQRLEAGWQRRLLMDLLYPDTEPYITEASSREEPNFVRKSRVQKSTREPIVQHEHFARIIRFQRGCCYLCGHFFTEDRRATREHVFPVSLGGKNEANILAAHNDCNSQKGNREPYPCETIFLSAVNAKIERAESVSRSRARRTPRINPAFAELQPA